MTWKKIHTQVPLWNGWRSINSPKVNSLKIVFLFFCCCYCKPPNIRTMSTKDKCNDVITTEQNIHAICSLEPFRIWENISTSKTNANAQVAPIFGKKKVSSNILHVKLIRYIADMTMTSDNMPYWSREVIARHIIQHWSCPEIDEWDAWEHNMNGTIICSPGEKH